MTVRHKLLMFYEHSEGLKLNTGLNRRNQNRGVRCIALKTGTEIETQAEHLDTSAEGASTTYADTLPHKTYSICPECNRILPALVYEEDGKVWITRTCPTHGETTEIYWEDVEMYRKARLYASPPKHPKTVNVPPEIGNSGENCPLDCGLCPRHKSQTALGNLVATNRCDLSCWYCFFYAREGVPIYEPPLEHMRKMLLNLRNQRPVRVNAVQITGGEPTLREDIVELVRIARDVGFEHIQLNTHGIKFAYNPELVEKLRSAGMNIVYLSFDGLTPHTNPKNHWEIPLILENLRKSGVNVVLVPTIIRTVNDHECGAIINFALNHMDIVRSVNFQPVSLVGRIPSDKRKKLRITIPETIKKIEEQTNGTITREDFFPVPTVSPITRFVEAWTGEPQYDLTTHFACGMGTYVYLTKRGEVVPITRFVDVPGLMEYLREKAQEIESGTPKYWTGMKLLINIKKFFDKEKQPKELRFVKLLVDALLKHNYTALGEIHKRLLFIGMMHFMDKYNYDIERVERCCIHYATPDGRIIPFCAFNVFPEIYRDKIQEQYSFTLEEWLELHPELRGKPEETIYGPKYRRNKENLQKNPLYRDIYDVKDYFTGNVGR